MGMKGDKKERVYVPMLKRIDIIQHVSSEHVQYFDEKQLEVIRNLERIRDAAADIQNAIKLFQEFDADGSGKTFEYFSFYLVSSVNPFHHYDNRPTRN
jgi:hypothetical protein